MFIFQKNADVRGVRNFGLMRTRERRYEMNKILLTSFMDGPLNLLILYPIPLGRSTLSLYNFTLVRALWFGELAQDFLHDSKLIIN